MGKSGRAIRVLLVDDSVVVRGALVAMLSAEPDIEVVATAPDGQVALARLEEEDCDIILLDIEMPRLGGIGFLKELRERKLPSRPHVLVFSSVTQRGAMVTLDALSQGADDYLPKPTAVGRLRVSVEDVRSVLLEKIRSLASKRRSVFPAPAPETASAGLHLPATGLGQGAVSAASDSAAGVSGRSPHAMAAELLAIGTSTGGPAALGEMLVKLPADLPVPVVIVQHMPPLFTEYLANSLDKKCELRVSEAKDGEELLVGHVYLAPGGRHLKVRQQGSRLFAQVLDSPPVHSCRPSVDVLFLSVAESLGGAAVGVILTGMGRDGLDGCRALAQAGAPILAQDEKSSVVWGMPGFVVRAGLANRVCSISHMAGAIVEACQRPASARKVPS